VNGKKGMTGFDTFTSTAGRLLKRLYADERGATAIEYAMVASGIGVVVSTAVYTLGDKVKGLFTNVSALFGS
jgi:pilus assembly protein Flp/PilA